jgi:phage terminase large subunit-like protein
VTTLEERQAVYEALEAAALAAGTDEEAAAVAVQIEAHLLAITAARWEPYVWQRPHLHPEGWVSEAAPGKNVCDHRCAVLPPAVPTVHGLWLQRGGRGTGKTEGAARYFNDHFNGPPCDPRVPGGHRGTIVAPTQADAVSSCVEGVSGLKAVNPLVVITTNREGTTVRWPNGAVGRLLGAHTSQDVDRARAWSNVCLWWLEEAAAMSYLGGLESKGKPAGMLDQAPYTLRLHAEGSTAPQPHMIVTTTPKNRPEVVQLLARTDAVETWGRTDDAYRLDPAIRAALEAAFRGTTAGAQELDGDLIADTPGALWVTYRDDTVDGQPNPDERPGIENDRVSPLEYGWTSHLPGSVIPGPGVKLMERVIIAVDPPGGRTEAGITVQGSIGQHGYLLADLSLAGPPDTWAKVALQAYLTYGAEGIAAEHTYGGDMVTDAIKSRVELWLAQKHLPPEDRPDDWVDWPDTLGLPPIYRVPTKVGKRLRAEPVQGLAQQHRLHHVGIHPGVETEQRTWIPGETKESPNRVDAYVHGFTFLLIRGGMGRITTPSASTRRIQRPR